MITVGICKPLTIEDINQIKASVSFTIADDYLSFIQNYGYGIVSDLLLFELPDEGFVKNNFLNYMHFWKWETKDRETDAIHSLRIGETIDGDIICCIHNPVTPYLIMPRHKDKPVYLASLEDVFGFYKNQYTLKDLYFMSNYDRKQESVFCGMIIYMIRN